MPIKLKKVRGKRGRPKKNKVLPIDELPTFDDFIKMDAGGEKILLDDDFAIDDEWASDRVIKKIEDLEDADDWE